MKIFIAVFLSTICFSSLLFSDEIPDSVCIVPVRKPVMQTVIGFASCGLAVPCGLFGLIFTAAANNENSLSAQDIKAEALVDTYRGIATFFYITGAAYVGVGTGFLINAKINWNRYKKWNIYCTQNKITLSYEF